MKEKSFHLWASLSVAAGLLWSGAALAQDKPKSDGGQNAPQSPATAPKNTDKPKADKPADKPDKPAEKADKPADNRGEKSDKATEKADKPASQRQDNAEKDKTKDAPSKDSSSKDKSKDAPSKDTSSDRSSPRDANRSDRDRSDRDSPPRNATRDDRSDRDRRDTDRGDRQQSRDNSKRSDKQVKASDLGFTFAESENDKGLKISKLSSKSIGSKADFKEGDIIISINDHRVGSQRDFLHWIHAAHDDRIVVIVLRDDREVTLYLEPEVIFETTTVSSGAWLGVDLNDRYATAAVVLKVHPNSPAERAGLKGDDVIVAVDDQRVKSANHLGEVIGRFKPGQEVEIRIERNMQAEVVDATLGRRENVSRRTEVLR